MDNLKVETFPQLSYTLKKQTESLRDAAFHKNELTEEQKLANQEKYIFEEGCFRFVIAFLDNQPVGYVRLFKRKIPFHEKEILLGGIGGVCTSPEEQRKGIATQMLYRAIEELRKEKCDIAYLCTDINKLGKLYGKVGFVQLNHQYTFVGESGKRYYESDGMIASICSGGIFNEVLNDSEPFDLHGMNW